MSPDVIGAAMGHTTSRMVERVYGRLSPADLGALIEARTSGLLTGGDAAETGPSEASGEKDDGDD